MKIQMLVFPGMTLLDLVGPLQVWSGWPNAEFQFVWKQKGLIETDAHLPVEATASFAEAWEKPDILFAPGGGGPLFALLDDKEVIDFIASRGAEATWVASVCTGAHVLGAAGLLKGYRAASHWYARDMLSLFGATPSAERYVIDRNRATGGGVTAGVDFGLAVMAHVLGERAARSTQLGLEYSPNPPFKSGTPAEARPENIADVKERFGGEMGDQLLREICTRAATRLGLQAAA